MRIKSPGKTTTDAASIAAASRLFPLGFSNYSVRGEQKETPAAGMLQLFLRFYGYVTCEIHPPPETVDFDETGSLEQLFVLARPQWYQYISER
jgi:hypothetical protein